MDLKDTLKERRSQLNISQSDLAEMADVSLATVKDIERGKGNPSIQTVEKLLAVLGMEIIYQLRKTV
ncbi:MAG: helix-turn-helix transcriptional regulator [Bacteroidales bacterium]|nr:helix-turn-helix transcriptional regulator [Bacteroidales bacterium]